MCKKGFVFCNIIIKLKNKIEYYHMIAVIIILNVI